MNTFLTDLKKQSSFVTTQKGAIAYNTTQDAILDLFSVGGALRTASEEDIIQLFERAYAENPLLAMKCLFYIRDIEKGQGERRVFRVIINYLGNSRPELLRPNLQLVHEYGRYDDLVSLVDTKVKDDVIKIIENQLNKDILSEHPSLLAKWLPSPKTSSVITRSYACKIRKELGLSERGYRKMLSYLRGQIQVTEKIISAKRWDLLDLEKLTANNYMKYQQTFERNIPDRWHEYIEKVVDGTAKTKSSTLYPYNIVNRVKYADGHNSELCNEQWKSLPDYSEGKLDSVLCMVDVSPSMNIIVSEGVTAMDVAMSLGLYVSERVAGPFNNHYITFSENPTIEQVKGKNLKDKVAHMKNASWGMTTNIEKAFMLILNTAIRVNASQEDIPKRLIIISDMQFDSAMGGNLPTETLYDTIKSKYQYHGYELPTVVFWNVRGNKKTFQVDKDSSNVLLCSGCSPSILKDVLNCGSPMDLVINTLNSPRYEKVTI